MLGFIPAPYPDELFYSLLARYFVRSGNDSFAMTMKDLFGMSKNNNSLVFFPNKLNCLVEQLPISLTSDDLISNHSFMPYFQPFLPRERIDMIRSAMKQSAGWTTHLLSGLSQSNIISPQYLQFCPDCIKADRERYGKPIGIEHTNYLEYSNVPFIIAPYAVVKCVCIIFTITKTALESSA